MQAGVCVSAAADNSVYRYYDTSCQWFRRCLWLGPSPRHLGCYQETPSCWRTSCSDPWRSGWEISATETHQADLTYCEKELEPARSCLLKTEQ